jgi:serine/threonine protein kinase/Tfp pilus assembly protein PilF
MANHDVEVTDESADRDPVEALAEEYFSRKRQGERPTVDEYADRFPDLADRIRSFFPAVQLLEDFSPQRDEPQASAPPPERLGEFRIVREIGRGGMGVVYEAEQTSLGRKVALKVLPPHAARDAAYLARFRREARTAARLHHTNIVPVYGVGEEDGLHFVAMQLIRGAGMDAVLAELRRPASGGETPARVETRNETRDARQNPSPASRCSWLVAHPEGLSRPYQTDRAGYYRNVTGLIAQAADALAYAHGQGVVHRDIKPGNLLFDDGGTLWVSDFGLAKAAGTDDVTQPGFVVGTPRYLAPERFDGKDLPAGDVYALGATLYELLTLKPAFEGTDRERLIDRVRRDEPTPPRMLAPDLPRDLETVCLKCLEKDPDRRYAAAALADDLRRWLDRRPVRARRIGPVERFDRWARRNPAIAGLTAALFVSLVAGLVIAVTLFVQSDRNYRLAEGRRLDVQQALGRAEKSEDDAKQAAAKADRARQATDAINRFYVRHVLDEARPDREGSRATVLESLAAAATAVPGEFADPRLRADVHNALGEVFREIGQTDKALEQHRLALELNSKEYGPDDLKTLTSLHNLALANLDLGRLQEAHALLRQLLPAFEARGRDNEAANKVRGNLGVVLEMLGKYDEALPLQRETFRSDRDRLGEEHAQTLGDQNNLALLLMRCGHADEGADLLRDLITKLRRLLPEDHHRLLTARTNLITFYCRKKQYVEALPIARDVLAAQRGAAGDDDPTTLMYMNNVGTILVEIPRLDEAEKVLRETVERMEAHLAERHPHRLSAYHNLGTVYLKTGRNQEAEALFRKALDGRRAILPARHPDRLTTVVSLGRTLRQLKRYDEAIAYYHEVAAANESRPPSDFYRTLARRLMADALVGQAKYAEAEAQLLENVAALGAKEKDPAEWTRTAEALQGLYKRWKKPDQAAEWAGKK